MNSLQSMTERQIISQRLYNQHIAETDCKTPMQIVAAMVAMQSQVWDMGKWAVGLRLPGATNEDVERAYNKGEILRTHVMRPTWHFVTPADIRWLLKLTSPRVHAFNAQYYRKMELDKKIFKKANTVFIRMLRGGKQLNRLVLKEALEKSKIKTDDIRFALLLMQAELDGLICSGAREGKQFTYTLLDERAPGNDTFHRDAALGELVRRYFVTRGPATVNDFAWWSGLTVKDAKEGLAMNKSMFDSEKVNGTEFIFKPGTGNYKKKDQFTFLMPDYDEYGISYKDRSLFMEALTQFKGKKKYPHTLIVNGVAAGTWKRREKNKSLHIDTAFVAQPEKVKEQQLKKATDRYLSFFKKEMKPL